MALFLYQLLERLSRSYDAWFSTFTVNNYLQCKKITGVKTKTIEGKWNTLDIIV